MIDKSNLKQYMRPMSDRIKRKHADGAFYKEMHGNRRFMITSWNSIADAKSVSWDLIIMDEIDEAKYDLKGQGDPEMIFAGRGKTIRGKKIAKLGTPTVVSGRININFLEGDQRFYFCQCPLCGEMQILVLKASGRDYGLTARAEKRNGRDFIIPETVYYTCKLCKKSIYEYQKSSMLLGGEWRPTATPVNDKYRSYHISNLMSPIMFYTWGQAMQEFAETDYGKRITKWKNFVIDVLGFPWESRTEKKGWEELKESAEPYPLGEIPHGGLVLTGGADVHKKFIVLKVVAWGKDMESWIIDYKFFHGSTGNKENVVWKNFENFLKSKRYKLKNITLPITVTAVDSGYNPNPNSEKEKNIEQNNLLGEHVVYEFVAKPTISAIACRGNPTLKGTLLKKERVYRKSQLKERYDTAVNDLKHETYLKLDLKPEYPGRIHFSQDLSDDFFKGFVSEVWTEIKPGLFSWKKIFEDNEPLDTYILARAGAEFWGFPEYTDEHWDSYEQNLFDQ